MFESWSAPGSNQGPTVCKPRTEPRSYNQLSHNLNFAYHTPLLIFSFRFLCTISCGEISFIKLTAVSQSIEWIDFSLKKFGTIFISQLDKVPDDIFDPEHMQKARLKCEKLMCSGFEPESTVCKPRTIPLSYNQLSHNLNFAGHTPLLILRSAFFYAQYRALK